MSQGPPVTPSDEALVETYLRDPRGRAGSAAIEQLIARWSGRVYRWAHRVVRDHDRALDLAQDSLLRMLEALPQYQSRGRFSSWLFVIVRNRCMSALRHRRLNVDLEIDPDHLIADGSAPDDVHETEETRRRVFEAMDGALDSRERAALWLRAYEGLSVEEITRVLEVDGASGARALLQTARRKLRAALADRTGGPTTRE